MNDAVARQGLVLMGCGKMGGAMLSGWLKGGFPPVSGSGTLIPPRGSAMRVFM